MREWTKEERYRVLQDPEELRDLFERVRLSDYRQTYHIQPVTGLLNDPNGFVWHDGKWHLFYQWCPWGAVHGLKYWYHVVSEDLVTWENVGPCIRPDTEWDNKGAYSGSALVIPDGIRLYYTGNHRDPDWTRRSYTCLVRLMDDGTVEKLEQPLFGPHPAYTEHQRDPKIIYRAQEQAYYIVLGAQKETPEGKAGCVLLYRSADPEAGFEFAGELKVPGYEHFGDMWECPSIERIGEYDVLLFCPQHLNLPGRGGQIHHNGYILGSMDYETLTFTPEGSFHVLDYGFDSYAAECAANQQDPDKAVIVAWMGLPDAAYPTDDEDWSGCLTLPRELTVRRRRLIQQPLSALKKLRGEEQDPRDPHLPRACEMELIARGGDLSLRLGCTEDGTGGLLLSYDDTARTITLDRSGAKQRFNTSWGEQMTRPLPNGLHHLRIFLDHSSAEIFVNDGDAVLTTRWFPLPDEHNWQIDGDAGTHLWKLNPATHETFTVQ